MIVDLLEEQADYPNLLTSALVVTDQKGDVVLEFPFSEALIARRTDVLDPALKPQGTIGSPPFPHRATPPIFARWRNPPARRAIRPSTARKTRRGRRGRKAHRPDSAPTDPALERLLNPGIARGTAGMGSGTGLHAAAGQFVRAPRRPPRRTHRAQVGRQRDSTRRRSAATSARAPARHQFRASPGAGLRRRSEQATDRRHRRRAAGAARRDFRHLRAAPRKARDAPPVAAAGDARRRRLDAGAGEIAARGPPGVRLERRHRGMDAAPAAAAGEIRRRRQVRAEIRVAAQGRPAGARSRIWSKAPGATTAPRCCSASPARARPSPWPR